MKKIRISKARVKHIAGRFSRCRIMVIGDAMLDKYLLGDVQRISPEAPVPIVQVQRETLSFGGAANVARNLRTLGVSPLLLTLCGTDHNGRTLRAMLADIGCPTTGILPSRTRPTTVKTRVMAKHQQIVRIDTEKSRDLSTAERNALWRVFIRQLPRVDGVIISDYAKGCISVPFISDVITRCRQAGVFVAVDPKVRHFQYYSGVDVITPNLTETHAALGLPFTFCTDREILDMGWKLLDSLDLRNLLITLSERGMMLFERKGRAATHLPTVARTVYDVTGAGDTVVGVFTAGICCGATPVEAALLSNHAAGLTVADIGTSSVSAVQLVKACVAH